MLSRSRFLLPLLLVATLAACQPVPRPFSHGGAPPAELLDIPGPRGIVVLPVADAPPGTADALARAMVSRLIDAGIPAFVGRGNRSSLFLLGQVVDPGSEAHIAWTLQDPDGREIGTFRQSIEGTPVGPWASAEAALMDRLVEAAVPRVVALVEPAAARPVEVPPIHVGPVAGVAEAVGERMRSAVRQSLSRLGARTSVGADGRALIALGEVRIAGEAGAAQQVEIAWSLYDPQDVKVGTIRQERTLPPVDGRRDWSPVIREAGAASAAGLYELVHAIDWSGGFAGPAGPDTTPPATR